jgi:4-hydroxy-3-methylbut-2-enyl diphosphate reductase
MVVGEIYNGKVKRIKPFGAFVSVNGNDCLVHISDISWTKINDPSEILEIGKSYDFKCLKLDRENNRVSLGYKQLQRTPYEIAIDKYPVGTVVKGKVERIFPYGAFISIEDGVDGLVHVSQICHEWIKNASDKLKVGDEVDAKVISFEGSKITLSIKDLIPKEEVIEQPVEEAPAEIEKEIKTKSRNTKDSKPFVKREKRVKKSEDMDDLKEWVSDNSTTTSLADLFKDFNMEDEKTEDIKEEVKVEESK